MKKEKEITLKLRYTPSKIDKEKRLYIGGVEAPRYQKELSLSIKDDYDFDIDTEEFIKNGKYAIELAGSSRALKELGKFLINMAMLKTEDENYHEHIDNLMSEDGTPIANLVVRKMKKE